MCPISGPPPGIPQVPIGIRRVWRAQAAKSIPVKVAIIPIAAGSSAILRAIMLSGLAAATLRTFQVVVGDVESDMDDLVDTIEQWLKTTRQVGFSRGRGPRRGRRELALPLPLRPLRKGDAVDVMDAPEPERYERLPPPQKTAPEPRDEDESNYWAWLERRFGNPPKYTNLGVSHNGIQQF